MGKIIYLAYYWNYNFIYSPNLNFLMRTQKISPRFWSATFRKEISRRWHSGYCNRLQPGYSWVRVPPSAFYFTEFLQKEMKTSALRLDFYYNENI